MNDLVKPSDFNRGRSEVPIRFEIEVMIQEQVYAYVLAFELPVGFKELRVYEEKLTVSGNVIYSRLIAEVNYNRLRNKPATFFVDWHVLALTLIQENSDTDPLSIFKMCCEVC